MSGICLPGRNGELKFHSSVFQEEKYKTKNFVHKFIHIPANDNSLQKYFKVKKENKIKKTEEEEHLTVALNQYSELFLTNTLEIAL